MNGVRWKFRQGINTWEGTIKGDIEPSLFIEGGLCVTDLRESRKSKTYVPAKYYKIIGLTKDEAKRLAEDLVNGWNFDKHEQNRLEWEADNEKSAKVIQDAKEFLKKLKDGK